MATTALSVWMSHSTSPAAIASPSALYHLTMVPSSMVGDRLGMFTATPGVLPPEAAAGGAAAVSLDGGGVAAVTPAAATSCHSSPSSATNAINVPTFTVRFSSVISLAMVPSSAASMDMTALSVCMSHTTSPSDMASPGALCHLTMVPSSMVGEREGMLSWMAESTGAVWRRLE